MAITRTNAIFTTDASTSGGPFETGPPNNNALMVIIQLDRNGTSHTTHGISETTGSGAWTKVFGRDVEIANSSYRRSFSVWQKVVAAGQQSFVATDTAVRALYLEFESTALVAWSVLDYASNDNGTTDNATSLATGTTGSTTGNQLVIGFFGCRSGDTFAVTPAFTDGLTDVFEGGETAYSFYSATAWLETTATGTKSSTGSISGTTLNSGLVSAILVFSDQAAGGGAQTLTGVGNIAVPVALGTQQVALDTNVTLSGLAVALAFGAHTVAAGSDISLAGTAIPLAFGANLIASEVGVALTGIPVPVSFFSSDTGGQLTWSAVSPVTEYRLKYGTSPGVYTLQYDTGSTATSLNISVLGLAPGTPYYFVVVGLNGVTEGAPSAEIRVVAGSMQLASINQLAFLGLSIPTAFGTSVLGSEVAILPSGLAVALGIGTAQLSAVGGPITLAPAGVSVPVAVGTLQVAGGNITLGLAGLAVALAVGRASVYDPAGPPPGLGSVAMRKQQFRRFALQTQYEEELRAKRRKQERN